MDALYSFIKGLVSQEAVKATAISLVLVFAAIVAVGCISAKVRQTLHFSAVFAWLCFVKPFLSKKSATHHQQALENFYEGQAHIYDHTRTHLLRGRQECMALAFSHLPRKLELVWVDVGGGTGYNLELMDSVSPLTSSFSQIYLVDLSPSLCKVARERCARNQWTNVHVIEGDASDFEIASVNADLITFSYSLSMIPTFYSAVDHVSKLLSPDGIIACVDFGIQLDRTSMGRGSTLGGSYNRSVSWFARNFWRIWFEADGVFLDSARRHYLEYTFGTVKAVNAKNRRLGNIPYYIWIGCDKRRSTALVHRINCLATELPYLAPETSRGGVQQALHSKGHEIALANVIKNLPYPSAYYQRHAWRVYYDEHESLHQQFRNQYIYAFTWEDPREDNAILRFKSSDTVLAITLAGDNILLYASLADAPRRIHAVDLNPSQGHLLELKLAGILALSYDQMWKMFGQGKINNFEHLLLTKLAPHMSSEALQFWFDKGPKTFDAAGRGFYDTGSTRWAIRFARLAFAMFGVTEHVLRLCRCTTLEEQERIWTQKLRPALLNRMIGSVLVGSPMFLWRALGVPANQASMMDGPVLQYVVDTLDPVIKRSLLSSDNYFYYLCLQGRYSYANCPDYLTQKGFKRISSTRELGKPINGIRIHTDTLCQVFSRLRPQSLTIAIIMDHMDWFLPQGADANTEVEALKASLAVGGRVLLRLISKHPWYIGVFERAGFTCTPAATRLSGESIDRINMYASTWVCTKQDTGAPKRRISELAI